MKKHYKPLKQLQNIWTTKLVHIMASAIANKSRDKAPLVLSYLV